MRISRKKPFYRQPATKRHQTNQFIKTPQVRLIDEAGQNLGVMATSQALTLAQEKGLDLVEVSPLAQPPVAKIIDYNKLKYQEEKKRHKEKTKQKRIEVKIIRLSLRISQHDQEVRLSQAKKFLNDQNKVKVEMFLKGRERQHLNLAREIMSKFIHTLEQNLAINIEQALAFQEGKFSVIIAKKN